MKQILVVGCGSIGERHLRCFLKTGRVRAFACDTNAALLQKMREEYQAPTFTSLKEALAAEKFDGIVICTPAQTHINIALTALRSGAGLLIEKPLSTGFDGLDDLKTEMAKAKKFVG